MKNLFGFQNKLQEMMGLLVTDQFKRMVDEVLSESMSMIQQAIPDPDDQVDSFPYQDDQVESFPYPDDQVESIPDPDDQVPTIPDPDDQVQADPDPGASQLVEEEEFKLEKVVLENADSSREEVQDSKSIQALEVDHQEPPESIQEEQISTGPMQLPPPTGIIY